jgi:hypothetical protein
LEQEEDALTIAEFSVLLVDHVILTAAVMDDTLRELSAPATSIIDS